MSKYFLKHKNDWSNCCVCFMRLLFWFGIRVLLGDESRLRLQSSLTVAAKGSRHHRVEWRLSWVEWERGWMCFDGALNKIPQERKSPSWALYVDSGTGEEEVEKKNWPVIQYLNKTYDSWREKSSKWRCVVNQNINRFFNRKFLFFHIYTLRYYRVHSFLNSTFPSF